MPTKVEMRIRIRRIFTESGPEPATYFTRMRTLEILDLELAPALSHFPGAGARVGAAAAFYFKPESEPVYFPGTVLNSPSPHSNLKVKCMNFCTRLRSKLSTKILSD